MVLRRKTKKISRPLMKKKTNKQTSEQTKPKIQHGIPDPFNLTAHHKEY